MVLEPGTTVDPIKADNQWGDRVRVTFEEPTVLYFYPRDDTPGCATEAKGFDAVHERYEDADVSVYGVSTDGVDDHCEFAQRHDLGFDLLADEDGTVAEAFDVSIEDDRCARTTFVVAGRRVYGVYEGVRPDGHARQVLRDLAAVDLIEA